VFPQVCELDIIFNFHKAYYILDELVIGGFQQESSKKEILRICTQQEDYMDESKGREERRPADRTVSWSQFSTHIQPVVTHGRRRRVKGAAASARWLDWLC
jgi:hypothetical protein